MSHLSIGTKKAKRSRQHSGIRLRDLQAVRPLTRPAILHTPRPLAGPSTLPSLPTSSRSLINRAYATTAPGSPASIATELEQEQDDREADEVADLAVSIEGQGRRPLEIPEGVEIPPNVRFEGFEHVEEPINRGCEWNSSLSAQYMKLRTSPNTFQSGLPSFPHLSSAFFPFILQPNFAHLLITASLASSTYLRPAPEAGHPTSLCRVVPLASSIRKPVDQEQIDCKLLREEAEAAEGYW